MMGGRGKNVTGSDSVACKEHFSSARVSGQVCCRAFGMGAPRERSCETDPVLCGGRLSAEKPTRPAATAPSASAAVLSGQDDLMLNRAGPQWLAQATRYSLLDGEGCRQEAWTCSSHSATRGT